MITPITDRKIVHRSISNWALNGPENYSQPIILINITIIIIIITNITHSHICIFIYLCVYV